MPWVRTPTVLCLVAASSIGGAAVAAAAMHGAILHGLRDSEYAFSEVILPGRSGR